VLSAERVALNFLSLLSGIATATKTFVKRIKGTKAKILDTRKTTPNLRDLEKYAVRVGGGFNHRLSLVDAILLKGNHLRAGKFIRKGKLDEERMAKCIAYVKTLPAVKIEIEVETLEEFKKVIKYKPRVVMLDNFKPAQMKEAVRWRNRYFPRVKLEASGGINLKNVRKIAQTGVDFISVGNLTHSPKAIDFSLEIVEHR
jgi:nicotinate-nucleotide pyrophosphorylase (carboxylating)